MLYQVSLKRRLRVVVVVSYEDPSKPRYIVLASTDTELEAGELYQLYRARFQIEFIFRKVITEKLALDLTAIKNHEAYCNLKTYGAIAA